MRTSLTLDTARRDDGKLVLVAAGEIDLSNIEAFDQALSTATTEAVSILPIGGRMRRNGKISGLVSRTMA